MPSNATRKKFRLRIQCAFAIWPLQSLHEILPAPIRENSCAFVVEEWDLNKSLSRQFFIVLASSAALDFLRDLS